MIRVAVVDDEALVRSGLALLLRLEPDMDVVGEAADGDAADALVRRERPDVVLMDIRMPRTDGLAATCTLMADPSTTYATAKTPIGHLLTKLGVRDRAQLVVLAYEKGVGTPGG